MGGGDQLSGHNADDGEKITPSGILIIVVNMQYKLYTVYSYIYRSRIHERTISLRSLGIILRVTRLEVSVWIS